MSDKGRIAQLTARLDRVGEIKEAVGVYAETKVQELAERKLRFDKLELGRQRDDIRRRYRLPAMPAIESTQDLSQEPWKIADALQNGRRRMKQDLTNLLRAVPFVPFTVKTRDGEVHAVNTVERMSVGNNVCTYIDGEGYVLLIPYHAIDQVAVPDAEHPA